MRKSTGILLAIFMLLLGICVGAFIQATFGYTEIRIIPIDPKVVFV